jgi:cyclopropane-fatty-acyl-phospholipid synthase
MDTSSTDKAALTQNPPKSWERYLIKLLYESIGSPHIFIELWDGTRIGHVQEPAQGFVINNRSSLWKLIFNPELEFGEGYSEESIDITGDLVKLLEKIYLARRESESTTTLLEKLLHQNKKLSPYKFNINPRRAQKNAQHHYDLSNDFYRMWLDEEMVYTCAYFPHRDTSLEQAQFAKMEHICKKLELKPGDLVIEAGCGWGGLSRHMARHYGVTVKAYNVSHAQIAEANRRCKEARLEDRITYIEDDYRSIHEEADVFVSVGMLEHVGPRHYRELGGLIDRILKPEGRGLIHTIGQNQSHPVNPWLHKYIFPGGHPPTLREMMDIFEPFDFTINDIENIGFHYALTLQHWLQRFEQHRDQVREMFDEFFVRMWRLYLSGSIANFTTGNLQLYQALFTRAGNQGLQMTRAHLYHSAADMG